MRRRATTFTTTATTTKLSYGLLSLWRKRSGFPFLHPQRSSFVPIKHGHFKGFTVCRDRPIYWQFFLKSKAVSDFKGEDLKHHFLKKMYIADAHSVEYYYYFYTYASGLSIVWPLLCGGGKECGFIAAKQHVLLFTGLELQVGFVNYLFSDTRLDSTSKPQQPSAQVTI